MAKPSLYSPIHPHFFQPLLPGFTNYLAIPVAFFLTHLDGSNDVKTAELRTDASEITWKVKIDSRRLSYGWEAFAMAHDLRVGDIVIFRHEGDLVFHVSLLGPSCCEIQYQDTQEEDNKEDVRRKRSREIEADSSPEYSCFVVAVTASNLRHDIVHLPRTISMSNSSMKRIEIVLANEEGDSWIIDSRLDAHSGGFYMRGGWRSLCAADRKKPGDLLKLKLVSNEETNVLQMFPLKVEAEKVPGKEGREVEADPSPDQCVLVPVTASNLKRDTVYLPKAFVMSNDLMKKLEIVLKNEEGESWKIESRHEAYSGRFYMRGGWRSFCLYNGKKPGDLFKFKLLQNEETPVLQLHPMNSEDVDKLEPSNAPIQGLDATTESSNKEMNSSPSQDRFVILTLTPTSFKTSKLNLPLKFTEGNGINKAGTIRMLDRYGARWSTSLLIDKKNKSGTMRLGRGWKGFCEVNDVSIDESFLLELVWEDTIPVLKFCSKC